MRFALMSALQLQKGLFSKPLSIIICARNESDNLQQFLPAICKQDYAEFEVLVVNDRSTDDSSSVLKRLQAEFSHLRVIELSDTSSSLKGKKNALSEGIAAARHPYLLLTDADCQPNSDQWASSMAQGFMHKKSISLGYGGYTNQPGFLNRFIRYETVLTAVQYFSWALWGLPYMGVGRNLGYNRELYDQANGFSAHGDLASGDDDLFISQVATGSNVSIRIRPESFTYSAPAMSWKELYGQKTRHYSTGTRYKPLMIVLLGLFSLTHFGVYLSGVVLLVTGWLGSGLVWWFVGRLLVQWVVLYFCCSKLQERDLLWLTPVFDCIFVLYYVIFTPALFLEQRRPKWRTSES